MKRPPNLASSLRLALALAILAGLLFAAAASAMASPNYQLNWFVPLSGGGSAALASPNYSAQLTYGQTAIHSLSSPGYHAGLGFWHGIVEAGWQAPSWQVFLPITLR